MAIRQSSGFSHLRPGAFHMFYKYATDIAYITESGREKKKQTWTWVSPKLKEGEVLVLLWHFYASVAIASVYLSKIPTQLPGTLTHPLALADPASGSTGPNSSFSRCPSLAVTFPWMSLTPLSSLLWDLAFPRLLPVS